MVRHVSKSLGYCKDISTDIFAYNRLKRMAVSSRGIIFASISRTKIIAVRAYCCVIKRVSHQYRKSDIDITRNVDVL